MSEKVCEALLLHLPSKESSGGLDQEFYVGTHDVFVAFSHEDDTADGVACGNDGVDDLGTGARNCLEDKCKSSSVTFTISYPLQILRSILLNMLLS